MRFKPVGAAWSRCGLSLWLVLFSLPHLPRGHPARQKHQHGALRPLAQDQERARSIGGKHTRALTDSQGKRQPLLQSTSKQINSEGGHGGEGPVCSSTRYQGKGELALLIPSPALPPSPPLLKRGDYHFCWKRCSAATAPGRYTYRCGWLSK